MTDKMCVVRESVQKLRAAVQSLVELHRSGQFQNYVTSEIVNDQFVLSLSALNTNDQASQSVYRSDYDIKVLGRAFLNTWNVLMQKSFVPHFPVDLKELCLWMANHPEYNDCRRPHLAHILGGLDVIIDGPNTSPDCVTIMPFQLPSKQISFDELRPLISNARSLSSGSSCKTLLLRYKGQNVVCKLGMVNDEGTLQSFWREALVLDHLQGAGGSPVLLSTCSDGPCLFMSRVEGKTLWDVYGQLTARGLVEVFLTVAHSLQQVHEAGVLHHDIKPDNVMVKVPMAGLGNVEASFIDFGLGTLGERLPSIEDMGVTDYIFYPWYAPETFYNRGVSFASDIFSLGIMIERLVVNQIMAGRVDAWPEGLQEIVADMVEYEQKDRPSLTEVIDRLTTILSSMWYLPRSLEEFYNSDDESDEDESDEDESCDGDESGEEESDDWDESDVPAASV